MRIIFTGDGGVKYSSLYNTYSNTIRSLSKINTTKNHSYIVQLPKNILYVIPFVLRTMYNIFIKPFIFRVTNNDVIFSLHVCSPSYKMLSFRSGFKVAIVHDLYFIDFHKEFPMLLRLHQYLLYGFLWKPALKKYNLLLPISNKTKNELLIHGFDEKKIHTVPIGIHNDFFQAKHTTVSRPHKDKYIMVVGTELSRKNMKGSIEAFAILKKKYPELQLIKIGAGTLSVRRNQTLEIIKSVRLEVGKDVLLNDNHITLPELIQYYKHAELLLFPSLEEGFGLPIVEAQAVGTPVITSNLQPMNDLVAYKELLVDPTNPKDIAEKCEKILSNHTYRHECIEKGYTFSQQYQWDNIAQQMLVIIEKEFARYRQEQKNPMI